MSTATAVPSRTEEQRLEGLRKANAVRMWRADLKRDIKRGERSVHAIDSTGARACCK